MRNFMTTISAIAAVMCLYSGVTHLMNHSFAWAILMFLFAGLNADSVIRNLKHR